MSNTRRYQLRRPWGGLPEGTVLSLFNIIPVRAPSDDPEETVPNPLLSVMMLRSGQDAQVYADLVKSSEFFDIFQEIAQ